MNEKQFMLLGEMFIMQWEHAIHTLEETIETYGEDAAKRELQEEVDNRMQRLSDSGERDHTYDFQDALVLPSLLLAGLCIDLDIQGIDVVELDPGVFELRDRPDQP